MYKIESLKMEHLMHAKIVGGRRLKNCGLQLPLKYIKRKKWYMNRRINMWYRKCTKMLKNLGSEYC